MKLLYLFSYLNQYTLPNFADFLNHATTDSDYQIVVLMQIEEQKRVIMDFMKQTDIALAWERVHFISPTINEEQAPAITSEKLKLATGILVWGGNMHLYQKFYASPEITAIINEKYHAHVPYAGVSAGSILALNFELITDIAIKPHFTEKNRFFELVKKMRKNKVSIGYGIDDNLSLKIMDNKEIKCVGKDSFYLIERTEEQEYKINVFKNEDQLAISN
ncbi:MAG: Type 1 glutamine amidotransferase-like domain-containing protein [Candidatus Cloacimonadales bacterium]